MQPNAKPYVRPMTRSQLVTAYRLSEKSLMHPWAGHGVTARLVDTLQSEGLRWEEFMATLLREAEMPAGFAWPQWTQLDEELLRRFRDAFPMAREGSLVASTDWSRFTVNSDGEVVIDAHDYKSLHMSPNLRVVWSPASGATIYSHRSVGGRHLGTVRAALRALAYVVADLGVEYAEEDGGDSEESRRQAALWQTIVSEAREADLSLAIKLAAKAQDFLREASDSYWQSRGGADHEPLEEWEQSPPAIVRNAIEAVDAWHRRMVKEYDA